MRLGYSIPLLLFLCIVLTLWRGLGLHPSLIPSPLINKPAPNFSLPTLNDSRTLTTNDVFLGHVTLLNVWATWCGACAEEHDLLLYIANHDKNVVLMGFDYKDDPTLAQEYLQANGNPYNRVVVDQSGDAAIDWGVYGTPETFIIDKQGIVRYKQVGTITPRIWNHILKPLIDSLLVQR